MNILKLKARIIEEGYSIRTLAKPLGIKDATLYKKVSGKVQFTMRELQILKKILHLSNDEFVDIFFSIEMS